MMIVELLLARRFAVSLRKEAFTLFTTIITTASIALGYSAIVIALSILSGYTEKITQTATRFTSDVVVRSQLAVDFEDPSTLVSEVRSVKFVQDVDQVLEREALIKHKGELDGIMINGLPDERYDVIRDVITQSLPHCPLSQGIVLGAGAARALRAKLGDTVTLILQKQSSNLPMVRRLTVVGIFQSGMAMQDDNLALVAIDSLRLFSGAGANSATAILIKGQSADAADRIVSHLRNVYPNSIYSATYKEVFQGVWSWIEMQRKPIPIVLGLISMVAVVSIVSALLLTIVQKTKSIAILITLGMPARRIGYIILTRAVVSASIGVVIGYGISAVFVYGQQTYSWIRLDSSLYYVSALPVTFDVGLNVALGLTIIILTIIVACVPMVIARRITPARALRFS
jgi:lipoprotein-releasing system permease protein